MTSIVGLNSTYKTWLAGDSAATDDDSIEIRSESKVWQAGDWVFGSCPSFRLIQVLKFKLDTNSFLPDPADTLVEDIVNEFIPALRNIIVDTAVDTEDGWAILLGGSGKLWHIQDDYSVSQVVRYTAIGSGSPYALGVLHYVYEGQASEITMSPYVIVRAASRAAGAYCTSVSPPYTVVKA